MAAPSDYLMAGRAIIERLKTSVLELRQVLSLEEIAQLDENAIASPTAYVVYDGDEVLEADGRARQGASQLVRQRWMVVLAVANARQARSGDAKHAEAGPLLSLLIAALAGWLTPPFRRPLFRVSAPRVQYGQNVALYPLMFAGELNT